MQKCVVPNSAVCGRSNNKVLLFYAKFLDGGLNTAGSNYSLACGADEYDSSGYPNQDKEENGAIGKCALWFAYDPNSNRKGFETCLRMARADYCAKGISFTAQNIVIEACTLTSGCKDIADGCYEATWNGMGYVCAAHKRAPYIKSAIGARILFFKKHDRPDLATKLQSCYDDIPDTSPTQPPWEVCRQNKSDGYLLSRSRIYQANGNSFPCTGEYQP
jgi:hypothetical protein